MGLFTLFEEIHAYLQRKPQCLEPGAISSLIPPENGAFFERNTSWKSKFLKWNEAHLVAKVPSQLS
jgi:hypothetical protein